MAHHKFNHNKVSKVLLSNYQVINFADDDYFSNFQPLKHKLFKKHPVPRLKPKNW